MKSTRASGSSSSRTRRISWFSILAVVVALLVAVSAFVIWTQDTYAADARGIESIESDSRLQLHERDGLTVVAPAGEPNDRGIVFLPGAKVEPEAYATTFAEVAAAGTTVVIVNPFLNLALIEPRSFEEYTAVAPEVTTWAVGGHSMGGVKACQYAEAAEVDALLLLASYCSGVDLADRDLDVLTLLGSEDGVINSNALRDARGLLPADAVWSTIEGATHAQFGDYGPQDGDGVATISDAAAHEAIGAALVSFLGRAGE